MSAEAGGILWLLRWELRLSWRNLSWRTGKRGLGRGRLIFNLCLVLGFAHMLAWVLVAMFRHLALSPVAQSRWIGGVLAISFLTAVSAALASGVNLMFTRNDLDLLCSSPLSTRSIFLVRGLDVALQATALPALVFLPMANLALLYGEPRWLTAYPMVAAIGLAAAATGLLLTLALVHAIGARRARTVVLVLSALFGASLFLALEAQPILGAERYHRILAGLSDLLGHSTGASAALAYPIAAAEGRLLPLLLCVTLSVAAFGAVIVFLPRGFAGVLQGAAAIGTRAAPKAGARTRVDSRFWRVVFLKEWRLIYREPRLLVQMGQQFIYLIPALALGLRNVSSFSAEGRLGMFVALVTFFAGQLAGLFSWLALCAEDAPELLAAAPLRRGEMQRAKLMAALAPVWVVALPAATWLVQLSLPATLVMMVCVAGITLSVGVFQLWLPIPGSRTDLRRRMRQGGQSWARQLAMMAVMLGWSAAAWCLPSGWLLSGLLALAVGLAGPVYAFTARHDTVAALNY